MDNSAKWALTGATTGTGDPNNVLSQHAGISNPNEDAAGV